jgi:hypothetical protein
MDEHEWTSLHGRRREDERTTRSPIVGSNSVTGGAEATSRGMRGRGGLWWQPVVRAKPGSDGEQRLGLRQAAA